MSGVPYRFMWITPGRVFYAGLLGAPSVRQLGAWAVYFSVSATLRLAIQADARENPQWQEGRLAVVPPYRPHRVTSAARHVPQILIEPETIDVARLPGPLCTWLHGEGILDTAEPVVVRLLERLCKAHDRLASQADPLPADDTAFDRIVFGTALPEPDLDPRVASALALLQEGDSGSTSAIALAEHSQLSFHRFLHLFKNEVGVPLRTFRRWKRARSWLNYVTQETNLTDIAYCCGYPDSAHFSRSVREIFGLQPKDVIAGSRRLVLHGVPKPRTPS